MPRTLAALQTGRISEWRATILVRETAVLTREDRESIDAELAGSGAALDRLEQLGDRALAAAAKAAAYRRDAGSVVARASRAEGERRVSLRPAPDTMAYLTALLPVRQAVSVQVSLQRAAEAARCAGDGRGRGQLMADTLVAAVTAHQGSAPEAGVSDVAVRLVMTDRALLDGDSEPARLDGFGPVPAAWARDLVATTLEEGARVFLARVFSDDHGGLVAMESRSRLAPQGLAGLVRTRDGGTCRTPWCDAPVRHLDHVLAHSAGGRTDAAGLQGLCEACNYTKQAPGWQAEVVARGPTEVGAVLRHTVRTTTPTGHRYVSEAPPLPGYRPPDRGSPIEQLLRQSSSSRPEPIVGPWRVVARPDRPALGRSVLLQLPEQGQVRLVHGARVVAAVEQQLLVHRQAADLPPADRAGDEAARGVAEHRAVQARLDTVAVLVEGHRVQVHPAPTGCGHLDAHGAPVGGDHVPAPCQDDQRRRLVGSLDDEVQVAVDPCLGADEGVHAPAAADPPPTSRAAQRLQHGVHLGDLRAGGFDHRTCLPADASGVAVPRGGVCLLPSDITLLIGDRPRRVCIWARMRRWASTGL
jgi:hypothetical protein